MPHIVSAPHAKQIHTKTTSQQIYSQLLLELEILQFQPNGLDPAPYIEQGKFYFSDAWSLNWRSGGLLFYYSFLNLAKALLINKGVFNGTTIKGTHVDHGLSCRKQQVNNFLDLEIVIKPPNANNVFALLYAQICREPWPFARLTSLKVRDLLPYIYDISSETETLYNIPKVGDLIYSAIRFDISNVWYEILCPATLTQPLVSVVGTANPTIHNISQMSSQDLKDWHTSHGITPQRLTHYQIIRLQPHIHHGQQDNTAFESCLDQATQVFDKYAFPPPVNDPQCFGSLFKPKISFGNQNIHWHQFLSNYMFAFALGSVLRYRPYLLELGKPEYFLADAWTRQAPVTTLRDFVINHNSIGIEILQV